MDPTLNRKALLAAVGCMSLWGLFPFLFQAMGRAGATPWEMLAWRTAAAAPLAALVVVATGQGRAFLDLLGRPRRFALLALSGALIGANWAVYIWAVDNGRTLSASLGYYINPLMYGAAAALIFRERIGVYGRTALGFAAAGVVLQAAALGEAPWISLALSLTFTGYGLVRKTVEVESQTGLLAECLVLVGPAVAYIAWLTWSGSGAFGQGAGVSGLLLAGGPATVLPLLAFAYAARRLPLSVLGFLQFITPSMLFVIGMLQGEPLNGLRVLSFVFIWAGLGVFAYGAWRTAPARIHPPRDAAP